MKCRTERSDPFQLVLDEFNAARPPHEHLSLNRWAQLADISSSTMYNLRAGRTRSNTWDTISKLAQPLGYTPLQLARKLSGNFSLDAKLVPLLDYERLREVLLAPPESTKDLEAVATGFVTALADSDTIGGFLIEDSSVDRQMAEGGHVVFDWRHRDLEDGRFYLISHDGAFMVRRYRASPARFEPDSRERYDTIYLDSSTEPPAVAGRVIGWGKVEP